MISTKISGMRFLRRLSTLCFLAAVFYPTWTRAQGTSVSLAKQV